MPEKKFVTLVICINEGSVKQETLPINLFPKMCFRIPLQSYNDNVVHVQEHVAGLYWFLNLTVNEHNLIQ